jgi:hypothetical protein
MTIESKDLNPRNAEYHGLCQNFKNAPTVVSVSSTTATSTQLAKGRYRVICDVTCYIKQGDSTITAATTDNRLPGDFIDYFVVSGNDDDYLAAITSSASGTLQIMKQV